MPETEQGDVAVTLPGGADDAPTKHAVTSGAGPGARWRRDDPDAPMPKQFQERLKREHWKRKEAERHVDNLLVENQRLKQHVGAVNTVADEQSLENAKSQLAKAQADLQAAIEDPDAKAQVDAQTRIAQWAPEVANFERAALRRKTETEANAGRGAEERPNPVRTRDEPPPLHENAQAWIDANSWFTTDPDAAQTAIGIHNKLKAEGFEPNSTDLYVELDRRLVAAGIKEPGEGEGGEGDVVEERPQAGPLRPTATPATRSTIQPNGAIRRPNGAGNKSTTLSPEEQEMARMQGMTPELYGLGKMLAEEKIDQDEYDRRRKAIKQGGRK